MHPPKFLYRSHVKEERANPLLSRDIHTMNGRHLVDKTGHTFVDCSTQGYLGFDHNRDITRAQHKGLDQYGNVVPWSRSVAVFDIFEHMEKKLAHLVKAEASNLFLSTTLLNHGVLAALGGAEVSMLKPVSSYQTTPHKVLFLMHHLAHMTCFEGAFLGQARGADLTLWRTPDDLETLLRQCTHGLKIIVTDGVQSMGGFYANLPILHHLAEHYDAYIYVDDAHGFGVVGEGGSVMLTQPDHPPDTCPYGLSGNGIVRYYALDYERILYVGCLSKAYGLPGAFLACSQKMKDFMLLHATPHDLGMTGQGSVMMGLDHALSINVKQGDAIRLGVYQHVLRLRAALLNAGYTLYEGPHVSPEITRTYFPIVTVCIADHAHYLRICQYLYDQGVLVTPEPFGVKDSPIGSGHLLRITITHGLCDADIDYVCDVFEKAYDI